MYWGKWIELAKYKTLSLRLGVVAISRSIALLLVAMSAGCSSMPDCRNVMPIADANQPVITALGAELQREHLAGTFDGLVWVAQGDKVLLQSAYGCADRSETVLNQATVISDMGSIAKTFTAAAVLQLAANHRLQLSATLGDFYPTAPAELQTITIKQLLAHDSGLDNFHNESDFEVMDKAEAERRILAMPLIAKPGETIAYSNAAYTLLAAIVEKVSGQSFQDYIHSNLLTPLKLQHTGFYQDSRLAGAQFARGYGGDEAGQTTYDKTLTWALLGAGGMVTSVEDLAVWFAALHSGAILPPEQPNLVFSAANERWLLGSFAKLEVNGEAIVQMGGSTDYGYTALLQFVPARDLLIILLFNAHDSKYGNATHHRISRHHILPILLADSAD